MNFPLQINHTKHNYIIHVVIKNLNIKNTYLQHEIQQDKYVLKSPIIY